MVTSPTARAPRRPRGAMLIEAMVAMGVLAFGILALMQLQVLGIYSNKGARAHTSASQLARELATGLESLPFDSPLLAPTAEFGARLNPITNTVLPAVEYADASPIPGVRPNVTIERSRVDSAFPAFRRRWTVQDFGATGAGVPARMIAISVIWEERGLADLREHVIYVSKPNPGLILANAAAYR